MNNFNSEQVKKGCLTLLIIQIFSTLSYAVLYSTLIFYLTNSLKINDKLATDITASFIALSFFLHLLGGIAGDKLLSFRTLFVASMLLQIIGLILLSISGKYLLFWALAIYLAGNGFNMTCINCMLSQLFTAEDKGREKAFLWNYSAMNLGYFIGFSMGGYFLLRGNYQLLFLLSTVASIIALLVSFFGWSSLQSATIKNRVSIITYVMSLLMLAVLVIILMWLLNHAELSNVIIISIVAMMQLFIAYLAYSHKNTSVSNKIWAYIILFIAAFCFYTISQLAPMGLNLFISRNVDLHFANSGITIAPQWLQNINPIVIIFFGPLLANFYHRLRTKGYEISIPFQFVVALIIMGFSTVMLTIGIRFTNPQGLSHIIWPIISIALQGLAEASFTPIGFAMVGQLIPQDFRGLLMGNWLTCIGIGAIFAGHISKFALGKIDSTNPFITNISYSHSFSIIGWSTITVGLIMLALIPFLKRLILIDK